MPPSAQRSPRSQPGRSLRAETMRLACMFSSILLFGAAGLLLFLSLQKPTELAPQQLSGEPHPAYVSALPMWNAVSNVRPLPLASGLRPHFLSEPLLVRFGSKGNSAPSCGPFTMSQTSELNSICSQGLFFCPDLVTPQVSSLIVPFPQGSTGRTH